MDGAGEESASHRHRIKIQFNDEIFPTIEQITLIKIEPCFQINTIEDQVTKYFYENKSLNKLKMASQKRSRSLSEKRLNRKHCVSWSPIQIKNSKIEELLSPSSSISYRSSENDRQHLETMQCYENLLEKMRQTDKKLENLSRSWVNIPQSRRIIVKNVSSIKTKDRISRKAFLQICLLTLIFFNLIVVYFFNDIHILWTRYVRHST